MVQKSKSSDLAGENLSDYLTESERTKLLANLHHLSVWVGVQPPEELEFDPEVLREEMEKDHLTKMDLPPEIQLDKGVVYLRHLLWKLIHEKDISNTEKTKIKELVRVLKTKEIEEEHVLREKKLTHEEAKQLYDETAGVIRTLLDLKDLLAEKEHTDLKKQEIKRKVDDVKRWNDYVEGIKKDPR